MGPVLAVVVVGFVALGAWLMSRPKATSSTGNGNGGGGNGGGGNGGGGNGGGGNGGGGNTIIDPPRPDPKKVKPLPDPMGMFAFDDAPHEPTGPDPAAATTTPIPGQYYQTREGFWGTWIARSAYGDGAGDAAPLNRWNKIIVKDPLNDWIHGVDSGVAWGGGIFPKYSGWNTAWQSGHLYPIVYIPVLQ